MLQSVSMCATLSSLHGSLLLSLLLFWVEEPSVLCWVSKLAILASIRNSGYKSWMLKAAFRTHKDSARATFVEPLDM